MINKGNIKLFISYLFQKRKGSPAPPALLDSWATIPDTDIYTHLKKMTQQWGWPETQLQQEIHTFLNIHQAPQSAAHIAANQPKSKPNHNYSTPPPQAKKPSSKSKILMWILILLLPVIAVVWVVAQYNQYNNLQRLYSVTDNVAIRNSEGENVGRFDIFSKNNSTTSLREADDEIYNIVVDKEGNISESRKLLLDDATFQDYLTSNEEKMVYINKNYLTNSKAYSTIQKTIFSELSRYSREMSQITSDYRKVIIGSMAMNSALNNLYIKNGCGNNDNEYSSLIKHKLKDKKTLSIICKMSDGKYYKFKGTPDDNLYFPPSVVQVRNPVAGDMVNIEEANLLFKYINGSYFLFSCQKENTGFHSNFDDSGDITYFSNSFDIN